MSQRPSQRGPGPDAPPRQEPDGRDGEQRGLTDPFLRALASGANPVSHDVAMIVAHPDDEVIGAGALLPRFQNLTVVHLTDGSPPSTTDARAAGFATGEEYARARRRELERALALAGIPSRQARELGCRDQEASLKLVDLTHATAGLLDELQPDVIVTHPYEGGHPDHDATAFATHAACRLLQARTGSSPILIEMASYHNAGGAMATSVFLPREAPSNEELRRDGLPHDDYDRHEEVTLELSEADRAFKRRLIDCFASQQQTLQWFPIEIERFRRAPRYVFTAPPHDGRLYYELFEWGMTGARFRELAQRAMDSLGLGGPL